MMPGSSKTVGVDKFPAGLRVFVVDDNPFSLMILERMLKQCNYLVTTCNKPLIGLSLLRENKNRYDIVLVDVHKPHMDGFRLLAHTGLEMDIPVIMISGDDSHDVVMQSVTLGACDFLLKPISIEILRNIWQHVGMFQNIQRNLMSLDLSRIIKGSFWRLLSLESMSYVNAEAQPSKILELMNDIPGMSVENVASRLQKFRLYLKQVEEYHTASSLVGLFTNIVLGNFRLVTRIIYNKFVGKNIPKFDFLNGAMFEKVNVGLE
ncbi:two-component response regulator ARR2-like [Bidens hawaiensis]|uniref:two-component response regulator ARR2-like n=1 Tax=Bidens hawaiensis TaxID=980011 RepID=UPI00404A71C8